MKGVTDENRRKEKIWGGKGIKKKCLKDVFCNADNLKTDTS